MNNTFFAMLSRMKYIHRWALMRNSYQENISEHSLEVAMLAHGLAVLGNKRLGKSLDADRAAVIAIFHDCPEIITGDMPTPIKYYSPETRDTFKAVEDEAARQLLCMLPEDLREEYEKLFFTEGEDEYLCRLVKAADRLSALIKCVEEEKTGNGDFASAKKATLSRILDMKLPEADMFIEEFLPAYSLTLDELRGEENEEK